MLMREISWKKQMAMKYMLLINTAMKVVAVIRFTIFTPNSVVSFRWFEFYDSLIRFSCKLIL